MKFKEPYSVSPDSDTGIWPVVGNVLSYVLLLAGVVTICFTAYVSVRAYTPGLFYDQWMLILQLMANKGHYPLSHLWAQHNEHRIPILRLLSLADLYLFGGRNLFLLIWNWLIPAAELLFLTYTVKRLSVLTSAEFRTIVALAAICLFNPNQMQNFAEGFQSAFFMMFFFFVLSIGCVVLYSVPLHEAYGQRTRKGFWIAALIAGALAECSLASGIAVWFLLPLAMFALKLPKREILITIAIGLFGTVAYLVGYKSPSHHSNPLQTISEPGPIFSYVRMYFAESWRTVSPAIGRILAPIALAISVVLWIRTIVHRTRIDRLAIFCSSVMVVTIMTAGMTALGRLKFGINQAAESRYQTPAMLFWCCLLILIVGNFARLGAYRRVALAGLQIVLLCFFVVESRSASRFAEFYTFNGFSKNVTLLAIQAGVSDPASEQGLYPGNPRVAVDGYKFLREYHVIAFPFPAYRFVGRSLNSLFKIAPPGACQGFLDRISVLDRGPKLAIKASGWAYTKDLRSIRTIFLTDPERRIVGVGIEGEPRADVMTAGVTSDLDTGWEGYGWLNEPASPVSAYALLPGDDSVCALAGTTTIPGQH